MLKPARGAPEPQLLSPPAAATEAQAPRAPAPCKESRQGEEPRRLQRGEPLPAATRESPSAAVDAQHSPHGKYLL